MKKKVKENFHESGFSVSFCCITYHTLSSSIIYCHIFLILDEILTYTSQYYYGDKI